MSIKLIATMTLMSNKIIMNTLTKNHIPYEKLSACKRKTNCTSNFVVRKPAVDQIVNVDNSIKINVMYL